MENPQQSNALPRTHISSTITKDEQVLVNAQLLSGNDELRLRDMHLGNHYSAQGNINQYFANRDLFELGTHEQRRAALLNSLHYTGENAKRDQLDLHDVGPDSFSWVKNSPLYSWLQDGTSPFWISGKPGSGKSTLMQHLSQTHWVIEQLAVKNKATWKILYFFFDFRSGQDDANTLHGAMKSFMQQIIKSDKKAAEFLLQPENDAVAKELPSQISVWIQLLAGAMQSADCRFCAFIDGLDEFEGSLSELCSHLEHFQDKTGLKICMASRPEAEIEQRFGLFDTFAMQEYNGDSIAKYIQQRFTNHLLFAPGTARLFTKKLRERIQTQAEGVILWVRLAVDELLRSCDANTTGTDIHDLLNAIRPEIESLYGRLLFRIPEEYKADAAWFLYLVASSQPTTSPKVLCQAVAFTRANTNKFLGAALDQDTILFRSKALLGNLLDFDVEPASHETARTDGLPAGLELRYNSENNAYFVDHNTRTTSWDLPINDLPEGWEAKFCTDTQRVFYVDHNTQTTTWLDPRERRRPTIRLLHYTLASYLLKSPDFLSCLSGEIYYEGRGWADLLQAVLHSADEAGAVDVGASHFAILRLLENFQWASLKDEIFEAAYIKLNPGVWQTRSDLLKHSLRTTFDCMDDVDPFESPSTTKPKLRTTMDLKILKCHLCVTCVPTPNTYRQALIKLRSMGRYDLVFSCYHGTTDHLLEMISSVDSTTQTTPARLHFNLLVGARIVREVSRSDDDMASIIKLISTTHQEFPGYFFCLLTHYPVQVITSKYYLLVRIAFKARIGPWVESHLTFCPFRDIPAGSISHWAQCSFDSLETCDAMLQFLTDASASGTNDGTSNDGRLLDLIVDGQNKALITGLFLRKLQHLAALGYKLRSTWVRCKTLDKAQARLRRLRKAQQVIRQDLTALIACFRYFRENRRWPDFGEIWQKYIDNDPRRTASSLPKQSELV